MGFLLTPFWVERELNLNTDDYTKLFNELLDKVAKMEMKRFLILVGLVAFGLLLFALPNIITAIKA